MHVGMSVIVGDRPTDSHSLWAYITCTNNPCHLEFECGFYFELYCAYGCECLFGFFPSSLSLNLTLTWTLTLTVTLIFLFSFELWLFCAVLPRI